MHITKEQTYGYAGSLLFGAVLLLFLFLSVLRTIRPIDEAGGILVNFGTVDEASGLNEPSGEIPAASDKPLPLEPQPAVQPVKEQSIVSSPSPEKTITQDTEETLALAAEKKKEIERKAAEERQRQAIQHQVAGAFGAGSTPGSSEGTGSGTGNQGSLQGNAGTGPYSGVGGYGDFSLSGRSLGKDGLPRPGYAVQEEGVIVVDITVNPQGAVIYAVIGKGTTIDNEEMRRLALDAAKKAQFNSISDTNNQSGKITYRYRLK
ncbi:MAG: TonB family protein [Dysgonamonadaceae bacterium]|jgi:TonB family protein|nr:TonB family protein [Dysgonamonadaceae bacterium]